MTYEVNVPLRELEFGKQEEFSFIEQFCQRTVGNLDSKVNISVIEGTPVTVNIVVYAKKKGPPGGGDGDGDGLPDEVKWFNKTIAEIKKIIRLFLA